MYFSEIGFMYFSEIYLKWHLSIIDFYLKKSKYIWAILVLRESVFSLLYDRGRYYTYSVQNYQKTQVKKTPKQQMLPHVI